MKFYEFSQNNSGGSFVEDKNLCERLFIEARTKEKAIEKAIRLGVYFDGVDDGTIAEIPKGKVGYIKPLLIVIFRNQ